VGAELGRRVGVSAVARTAEHVFVTRQYFGLAPMCKTAGPSREVTILTTLA